MSGKDRTFIFIGRIPFDDENSYATIKAPSVGAAKKKFIDWLYDQGDDDREEIKKANGVEAYVMFAFEIFGQHELVLNDA